MLRKSLLVVCSQVLSWEAYVKLEDLGVPKRAVPQETVSYERTEKCQALCWGGLIGGLHLIVEGLTKTQS